MKFKKVRKLLTLGKGITIEKLDILKNGEVRFSTVASFIGIDLTPDDYDNLQVCYIDPDKTAENSYLGYRVGLADPDTFKKVEKKNEKCSGYWKVVNHVGVRKKNQEKIKPSIKKKEKKKDKVKQ